MTAPLLVCLHAITRSADDFRDFHDVLPDGLDVFVPDLIGHGRAPRLARYRLEDYAAPVIAELDSCAADQPVILFGHSLGGLVALSIAEAIPKRIAGIVLEDAPLFEIDPARFRTGPFFDGFSTLHDLITQPSLTDAVVAAEVATWPAGKGDATIGDVLGRVGVTRMTNMLLQLDPRTLQAPMAGDLCGHTNLRDVLRGLHCPVALLAGSRANGSALTQEDIAEFETLAQLATVHVFRDLGHDIRRFEPRACVAAISELLRTGS